MRFSNKLLLGVLLALGIGSAIFSWRYPGFSGFVVAQARHAGLRESWNNYLFVSYLVGSLEQLAFSEQSGMYDFEAARRLPHTVEEQAVIAYENGEFDSAVDLFARALEDSGESERLLFWLANAHLRRAEADNCLAALVDAGADRGHGEHQRMCTLPIERHHQRREDTERAVELLGRLRTEHPSDRLYQWLLNFAHMALGGFPTQLATEDRIDTPFIDAFYGPRAEALRGANADLVFEDRAAALHVDTLNAGKGVAVEDFDGDGDFDIVTGGNFDRLRYYSNLDGKDFVERTREAGLGEISQVHIITAADYDNDGWVDLFVGRPLLPYLLLRNNQDGTFVDVTAAVGLLAGWLEDEVSATWAPVWGDADGDGDLDLFIAGWGLDFPFAEGLVARPRRGSAFFLNDDGRFFDSTVESGLSPIVRDAAFVGAAWGDADDDGDLDLFLSGLEKQGSRLMRNLGDARFETAQQHASGFMAAFLDVDHDGRLELFHGGFTDARTSTAGAVFGDRLGDSAGASSMLARGIADKYHAEPGFFDGGGLPIATMGASFGDLDLDGCADFYLGTGSPEGWFVLPNLMFRGDREEKGCARRATNVSMLNGFGTTQKGHGIVFFDFDNDGDQDIYSSLGGMWPGDRWPNQLFVNESRTGNRWVKLRLRGRRSNRYGLGARITVRAVDAAGAPITRTYLMDHKTGFGSPPYLAHIGLLDATTIRRVEVTWPGTAGRCVYPARLETLNWLDEAGCMPD